MTSTASAEVAVIGGSGFYSFIDDVTTVASLDTPYGEASGPASIGRLGERLVAFLPRHGAGHALPPHRINYRANLWLLRSLGVRQVLAPCAVGGLRPEVSPGEIVVPDQLVDRTSGRADTFVTRGAVHVPFADPYCPRLSAGLADQPGVSAGGTMVVIEGPRFSTRAESRWYAAQGWTLVNMTGHPEAVLAREMRMCYAAAALVTDSDAGAEAGDGIDQHQVFATFEEHIDRLKQVLIGAIHALPDPGGCDCAGWADGIKLGYDIPGPAL